MRLLALGLACSAIPGFGRRTHRLSESPDDLLFSENAAEAQNQQDWQNPSLQALASYLFSISSAAGHSRHVLSPMARNIPTFARTGRILQSDEVSGETRKLTAAEKEEIGNLVKDDEWLGLGMELAIVARSAIRESLKSSVSDFTGKDDYKVGDVSKELDTRIKAQVAELRDKDEYELGDLSIAIDKITKDEINKLTGKDDYEFGDLSIELDKRIKSSVSDFCGKEEYSPGDLSLEIDRRIKSRVEDFTGKPYEFGDISREIEARRVEWVQNYLGKEDYEFGDLTKKLVSSFTGKEEYEFGDLTKKAVSKLTGKDEYEFGDITKALGQKLFGNKQVPKKK